MSGTDVDGARLGLALVADGLVAVAEAAAFLGVSRSALYLMMDRGELPFVKLGRSRRVPKRALQEIARQRLQGAQTLFSSMPAPEVGDE